MKTPDTPENEDESEGENLFQDFAAGVNDEDIEAQEEAMLKVWQHIAEKQNDEPSPWLKAMGEAHQCEAAFDWTGAEEAYKRAIDATKDQPMLHGKAQAQLASLYNLMELDVLALEATQAATRAVKEGNISSLTSFQLQSEARFYLKAKDFARAWTFINEAFRFVEDGPLHHLERTYALILRAECYIQQGDLQKAEPDLEGAWKLLEPHAETFFAAGWQGGLAQWWATKAQLHAQRQQWLEAVTCKRESVERRRIISQLPQLEGPYKHNGLAKALNDLGKALHQIEDDSASQCFAESRSIRHSIGLPPFDED